MGNVACSAAREMRSRIDEEIKTAGIDAKPYLIDVHTFHSYAYDYLSRLGLGYELAGSNMLRYSVYKSLLYTANCLLWSDALPSSLSVL